MIHMNAKKSVQMGDKYSWMIEINDEMNHMPNPDAESNQWNKRSIYRVSEHFAYLNSSSLINQTVYKPLMVSIGPYHHGDKNLTKMEEHKRRALLHVIKRSKKPLQSFVDALAPVVSDLRDAYDQLANKWHEETEAFIKLMIMDGCFILEILRTFVSRNFIFYGDDNASDHDYAANDPIFSSHARSYIVNFLRRDMLILENQIPMLVLYKLFAVQNGESIIKASDGSREGSGRGLVTSILIFFAQTHVRFQQQFHECLHILDLYRKSLFLLKYRNANIIRKGMDHHHNQGGDVMIWSATELKEAGIRIESSKMRSFDDISFKRGVLKLPLIVLDDAFESTYLNLIAFERFHVGAGNQVASYIFFMDSIIHDARDVELLRSSGIILNALGSDKAVVNLINSLSKDIALDPNSSIAEVNKKIIFFCQRPYHKWRYNLMHNYFYNPWAFPSVMNAICLFILTIIQTVRR